MHSLPGTRKTPFLPRDRCYGWLPWTVHEPCCWSMAFAMVWTCTDSSGTASGVCVTQCGVSELGTSVPCCSGTVQALLCAPIPLQHPPKLYLRATCLQWQMGHFSKMLSWGFFLCKASQTIVDAMGRRLDILLWGWLHKDLGEYLCLYQLFSLLFTHEQLIHRHYCAKPGVPSFLGLCPARFFLLKVICGIWRRLFENSSLLVWHFFSLAGRFRSLIFNHSYIFFCNDLGTICFFLKVKTFQVSVPDLPWKSLCLLDLLQVVKAQTYRKLISLSFGSG